MALGCPVSSESVVEWTKMCEHAASVVSERSVSTAPHVSLALSRAVSLTLVPMGNIAEVASFPRRPLPACTSRPLGSMVQRLLRKPVCRVMLCLRLVLLSLEIDVCCF